MTNQLYTQLFNLLKELGAIRTDLSAGCDFTYEVEGYTTRTGTVGEYWHYYNNDGDLVYNTGIDGLEEIKEYKTIGHPAILSDCLNAIHLVGGNGAVATTGKIIANLARTNRANGSYTEMQWDLSLPLLSQQSQEVGEKLLELLTD